MPGDSKSGPFEDTGGERVSVHRPVLVESTLVALDPRPGQVVIDATVGAGGHASRILLALAPGGKLIGIDRDAAVLGHARRALEQAASRGGGVVSFVLHQASFSRMQAVLKQEGQGSCDRVLLDLGVSSLQLDSAARGFSFLQDGPLDMRMDQDDSRLETAERWLARVPEAELSKVIYEYGEERHARRVARAIVAARRTHRLQRTSELAELIARCIPTRGRPRIHPATRTFQAIRIRINDELGELERGLDAARTCLAPGGRVVVISFHSLEDRIVKHFLRAHFDVPERKPILATEAEMADNPRARSAKLRYGVRRMEVA